jgi:hypothetical protein
VRVLRRLEPENPCTQIAQVQALRLDTSNRYEKQMVEIYLRASELGQQQGSDYNAAYGAANAFMIATSSPWKLGHSCFAAALAAYEERAEASLRKCKNLLPEGWLQLLTRVMESGRLMLPRAREQLQQLAQLERAQRSSGSSRAWMTAAQSLRDTSDAQRAAVLAQVESFGPSFPMEPATDCDGCARRAVGLRRCSRCKKAQYCRWEGAAACCTVAPRACLPACLADALFCGLLHFHQFHPPSVLACPLQPGVPGRALACA